MTDAILAVHDRYTGDLPSGENLSFEAEVNLLRSRGHAVTTYTRSHDEIAAAGRVATALRALWNPRSRRELAALIAAHRPRIAHFQNTFPLISPSAYAACREAGVPIVQALRNYRLGCPVATLYRDGRPCEDCVGRTVAWPGILHGCYKGSRAASAAVAAVSLAHRMVPGPDLYVTPSAFARETLIRAGLPADRIAVKPNFLAEDPGVRTGAGEGGFFAGRLSTEKGVSTLLRAWAGQEGYPLRLAGDGPLRPDVERAAAEIPGVAWLGVLPAAGVLGRIRESAFVVFPSEWYETFGRVVMEAFACGVPVIAARLGAMAEAVEDGKTGLLYTPGAADELADKIRWARGHLPELAAMGRAARAAFEARYTAARNYALLLDLYTRARELMTERRS